MPIFHAKNNKKGTCSQNLQKITTLVVQIVY